MQRITSCLVLAVLLSTSLVSATEDITWLDLTVYKNDTVKLNSIDYTSLNVDTPTSFGEYNIRTISSNGSVLYSSYFTVIFSAHVEIEKDGRLGAMVVDLDSVRKIFRLPYSEVAEKVELYKEGKLLFEATVPHDYKSPKKPGDFLMPHIDFIRTCDWANPLDVLECLILPLLPLIVSILVVLITVIFIIYKLFIASKKKS
ncbi:MAG TPA: hypothetical protein VJH90_03290 [archaeon]|nr:hypothetical protein [archaeon]